VRARVAEAQAELAADGVAFDRDMRVGVMVEVPSAAFVIDQLAAEVDFFSIGTNDLTQYFLAVDRDSDRVAALYSPRHPAFLRFLVKIVDDARRAGRWVGMCGEMARSASNLPLLVGLGLDEISAAAPEIPRLKAAIAQLATADCRAVLERALACRNVAEVDEALAAFRAGAAGGGLLDRETVIVGSDAACKEEAIQEIVDAFYVAGRTESPRAVEQAVWAREETYSTGLGHGFAVPHCKTDAVAANSIGVLRLARPVDWGSVDGQPVECVILMAIRETDLGESHMRVFAQLARRLMDGEFRQRLLAAPDGDAVLDCLAEELGLPRDPIALPGTPMDPIP
jgi:fructose-specific PTS system IIA-like component